MEGSLNSGVQATALTTRPPLADAGLDRARAAAARAAVIHGSRRVVTGVIGNLAFGEGHRKRRAPRSGPGPAYEKRTDSAWPAPRGPGRRTAERTFVISAHARAARSLRWAFGSGGGPAGRGCSRRPRG